MQEERVPPEGLAAFLPTAKAGGLSPRFGELSQVYAQLNQQDVEQFYTGYQWWKIQQQIIALQAEIGTLRQQIDENAQYMQEVHPPAVALATLVRLQANGVHDLELLDRMLERGEGWLDLIVQRLDYCEQLEFIPDNYTQWCEHALEGAYDWIDSMRGADALAASAASSDLVDLVSVEATEELLLRKLTSGEEEEFVEQDNAEILLADEAVAEFDSSQIAQAEQQSPLSLQIPQTFLPDEAGEQTQEMLLQDPGSAEQETEFETEFQDGDFAPALEIQLPTAANAEADLSLDIQVEHVHSLDEPQELLQQEMEIALLVETTAIDDSSLFTEEQHPEQQTVEPALALDAPLPKEVDAVDEPAHVSGEVEQAVESVHALDSPLPEEIEIEQGTEQRAAEPAPILEDPSSFEGSVEADSAQVPIDQVAPWEDTGVSATQETPLPIGADSSTASDELHNEQVAETVAVAEVPLPVETNAEITSPIEAAPEAVHTVEESISPQDIESTPAQNIKPRGFWRWLLALFRN